MLMTLTELLDAYRDAIIARTDTDKYELAARRAIVQYVESLKEKLNAKG